MGADPAGTIQKGFRFLLGDWATSEIFEFSQDSFLEEKFHRKPGKGSMLWLERGWGSSLSPAQLLLPVPHPIWNPKIPGNTL